MVKKTTPERLEPVGADDTSAPRLANPELPYAQIEYATNNSLLYPVDALEGTVATITVTGMQAAPVTLYWSIKGQEKPTFDPIVEPGDTSGSVKIDIPWQYVSTCIGHTVLIWYTATVGGRVKESLVLELEIQDVREEHLRGSLPVFKHARANSPTDPTVWLRMNEFVGDELVYFKAWPMIQAGQRLFLTVAGDQHVVPYQFIWVAMDHTVTEEEAHPDHVFVFPLRRGWMSRRQDYSALTSHLGVIWDGTEPNYPQQDDPVHENPLPINAQDFHLRTTTLLMVDPGLKLPPPEMQESTQYPAGRWAVNPLNTLEGAHIVVEYDMYLGDIVCPTFRGTPELGSPAIECRIVQEGETRLEFRVPPSTISANFNLPVELSYTVGFNNYEPSYSPVRVVDVLDIELPRPDVWEATSGVLDLNNFPDDATGSEAGWHYIALGQFCWMWVTGKREDDSDYSFEVLTAEPVTQGWVNNGVDALLPREALQELADCELFNLHFAVSFNGKKDREKAKQAPVRTLKIVQEDLVLKAPSVREAVGKELTVWNGRDGVTVRAQYEKISPHQNISVCWQQRDGTCFPLASQPGNRDPGYVDFLIPREAVISANCKTTSINYTVTSKCKIATSPDLELHISKPVRFPTLKVQQATSSDTNDGILDLRTFSGDADLTVGPWWFAQVPQYVRLKAVGMNKNGVEHVINVYIDKAVTAAEVEAGLKALLKRSELEMLKDESSLTITCEVMQEPTYDAHCAVLFKALVLTVRVITMISEDFTTATSGYYAAGTWVRVPGLSASSTTAHIGIHAANPVVPGMNAGNTLVLNCNTTSEGQMARQQVNITLNHHCKRIRFSYTRHVYYAQFIFLNAAGGVLGTYTYASGQPANNRIDYSASAGQRIAGIRVFNEQHSYLDNFEFYI